MHNGLSELLVSELLLILWKFKIVTEIICHLIIMHCMETKSQVPLLREIIGVYEEYGLSHFSCSFINKTRPCSTTVISNSMMCVVCAFKPTVFLK